ncbi:MAG: diacylglycerol/polyprenol kinase family protein [Promethearchaeia archaeon]
MLETNWTIVAGIYNTTFTLFFFLLAFLMFFVAYRGYKAKNNYGGSSTTFSAIIFIIFGYYNSIFGFLPYPYNGYMIWWIGIILGIFIAFALAIKKISEDMEKQKHIEGEVKDTALRRFVRYIRNNETYQESISIKMEGIRKSFHLAGLLFLLSFFGFFFIPPVTTLVNNSVIDFIHQQEWSYNLLWGDVNAQYPYVKNDFQAVIDLTLFALIAVLVLTIISDLIRVLWGAEYSIFNFLTKNVLRKKEYNAAGPQIYLITGAIVSFLFYVVGIVEIWIVVCSILVACFSDALAALIGRTYGKHKIKCIGGEIKSVEGFLAGAGSAYLIGVFTVGPFYALFVALIFFLLDYFPIVIADNILNPILITLGLFLLTSLFGLPVGLL